MTSPFRPRRSFSIAAFRRDIRSEIDEELRFHIDRKTDELVRAGWSPEGARAEAERLFGDYDGIAGECRALGRKHARRQDLMERLGGWGQDVSFAARQMRRHPGFALTAVLTLALGIGATSTIFSVVNGVLLQPLPYDAPAELFRVWVGSDRGTMSKPDIDDVEGQLGSVQSLIGFSNTSATVTGMGEPMLVTASRVSEGVLEVFRVAPALGRDIRSDESGPTAAAVVVIGHAFWQRTLGGAPDVLGSTLEIGGVSRQVVGVAPPGFDFPERAELWYPREIDPANCGRGCHTWQTVGQIARGATIASVQAELDGLAVVLAEAHPESNTGKVFRAVGLQDDLVGDVRSGLWILLGAVAAVLLIACANVANLLLVRASDRTGEMAVRGALGATRRRLVRQTLVESALLAAVGGALGLILAVGAVGALRLLAGGTIPRMDVVRIDGIVVLFTVLIASLVALLFGTTPALQNSRTSVASALAYAGRGAHGGAGQRQRRLLVTAEIGLSVVLLVAAGLLLRTFGQLHAVNLGYQTEDIVRFSLNLPSSQYPTLDEIRPFYRTLEGRLSSLPGVESVGSVYGPPLGSGNISGDVLVDGKPEPEPGQENSGSIKSVSPGYLETMRIPVIAGRGLTPADDVDGLHVALVNETLARENFGAAEDAIGEGVSITADFGYGSPMWRIVGVVADIRSRSVTGGPQPEIYVPHGRFGPAYQTISLRMVNGAGVPTAAIRAEVRRLDSDLPIRDLETVEQALAAQVAPTRLYLMLVSLFAGLAVVLAAVGLYGVVAYLVSTRTREIGVRVALGADRGRITRLVIAEGLRPAATGVLLGLALAVMGGRVLEAVLFGVEPRDPAVLVTVPVLLSIVAIAAAWVPAARAARLDPGSALRSE